MKTEKPTLEEIQEWFAKRTNREVSEFDEYDMFVCHIVYEFESR